MTMTWNPAWLQPGESIWAASNKIAFACCGSVADAMKYIAGVERQRRESWLFPTTAQAQRACKLLKVSMQRAQGGLFACLDTTPSLQERENWQLAIRHCPTCLSGFVHRAYFQDRRVRYCREHGKRLVDGCLVCGNAIDPLCESPWTCNVCSKPLAKPSALSWPTQFRLGVAKNQPTLPVRPRPPAQEFLGWSVVNTPSASQLAYEEHTAVCGTLLAAHRGCVWGEEEALIRCASPVYFTCPAAAAAIFVANQLGFTAECLHGSWSTGRPRQGDLAMSALVAILTEMPARGHRRRIRQQVRHWLADALEQFLEAAANGKTRAFWRPKPVRRHLTFDRARFVALVKKSNELCATANAKPP